MDVKVTLPKSRGGLEHLYDKADAIGMIPTWEFGRFPKDLQIGDRLYVVCEGFLRGYFIVEEIEPGLVHLGEWVGFEDDPIPHEPVRGFQYVRDRGKLRGATKK